MPVFDYTARNSANETIKGSINAHIISEARQKLRGSGLIVTVLKQRGEGARAGKSEQAQPGKQANVKLTTKEMIDFFSNLATMQEAGISLIESLLSISRQMESKSVKYVIDEIRKGIESGSNFADSMERFPGLFPQMAINLCRAGEEGGFLVTSLNRIVQYIEREDDIKHRVISALIYPAIVLCLAAIIVSFILVFVIPVFSKVYGELGGALPLPTQMLIDASNAIRSYWLLMVVLFVSIIISYKVLLKNRDFLKKVDELKLRVPLFGTLVRKMILASFCRTLGSLLSSGIGMVWALQVTKKVIENTFVRDKIDSMVSGVKNGAHFEDLVADTGLFPQMVAQMIAVGNQTGRLDLMLNKSADSLDKEIEILVKRLLSILDPVLTIFIAVVIGFITISIYLPMFNVSGMVR